MSTSTASVSEYQTASSQPDSSLEFDPDDISESDVTFPPSSNSSTGLPISSPPASFNTLDFLDERSSGSSTGYEPDGDTSTVDENWHDVPTRGDMIMEPEADEQEETTPTPSYTYESLTHAPSSTSDSTESTIRPRRRRKSSTMTPVSKPKLHDRLMWPLSKDMLVIVIICFILACILVMVARPFTVAYVVNKGYYD